MSRRRARTISRRPAGRDVAQALLIGAAAAALAVASGRAALTAAARNLAPDLALRVSPGDPNALIRDIDRRLAAGERTVFRAGAAAAAARTAIREAPINSGALRILSLDADLNKHGRQAYAALVLSERLSRRDVGTQLLLLEKDVARDDVRAALVHYDIILRVRPKMADVLFPRLADAATDPAVAREIAAMLRPEPLWLPIFIDWTIAQRSGIEALGPIFAALPARSGIWTSDRKGALIARYIAMRQFDTAFRLYRRYAGTDERAGGPGWFRRPAQYPPIDWIAGSGIDLTVSLGEDPAGRIDYQKTSGSGAVILSRLMALPPGGYQFSADMRHDVAASAATPEWTLSCADNAATVLTAAMPVGGNASSVARRLVIAPGTCRHQWLRLTLRTVTEAAGQSGSISKVAITPAG